jgi:hypothetical protein
MMCPVCSSASTVLESAVVGGGKVVRRRRACRCGARWTTTESRSGEISMSALPAWKNPTNGVQAPPQMGVSAPTNGGIAAPLMVANAPTNGGTDPPLMGPTPPTNGAGGKGGALPSVRNGSLFPDLSDQDPPKKDLQRVDRARARQRRASTDQSPAFKAFYAAYPRKRSPDAALRAWRQYGLDAHVAEVMAALAWQAEEFARRPPDKVPYPATWINSGAWRSERDAPAPAAAHRPPANGSANVTAAKDYRQGFEQWPTKGAQ